MKKIEIKGTIVSDSQAEFYRWFGIPCTSPASVELPEGNEDILVEINSGGGEVFAGSEIFTKLAAYEGKVTARVVGLAASAASVILMGADEIEISPTAQIMIHNAWGQSTGDYRDLEKSAGVLEGINKSITKAYMMKTEMSESELLALMEEETWMSADEAVELGFADRVMFTRENAKVNVYASAGFVLPQEVLDKIDSFMKEDNPISLNVDQDTLSEIIADKVVSRLQEVEKTKEPEESAKSEIKSNKRTGLFLF